MPRESRFRASLVESLLIVASVLLALWAENWREGWVEVRLEREYLGAIADGLAQDTAAIRDVLEYTGRRDVYTRLVLAALLSDQPPDDPEQFLIGVEASARFVQPAISRAAYDDLVGSGQFNLIRNSALRRQATAYYDLDRDPVTELWRSRVWYQYGPVAIAILPFDVQEWAASTLGDVDSPSVAPRPANLDQIAGNVADRLRREPDAEGLVKAVLRSNANQSRTLQNQFEMAVALLAAVETELVSR